MIKRKVITPSGKEIDLDSFRHGGWRGMAKTFDEEGWFEFQNATNPKETHQVLILKNEWLALIAEHSEPTWKSCMVIDGSMQKPIPGLTKEIVERMIKLRSFQ